MADERLKEINKWLSEASIEEFKEATKMDYNLLQMSAKQFVSVYNKINLKQTLENYNILYKKYEQIRLQIKAKNSTLSVQQLKKENIEYQEVVKNINNNRAFLQNNYQTLYTNLLNFSKSIELFLGHLPSMFIYTLVDKDSGEIIIYKLPLEAMLETVSYLGIGAKFTKNTEKQMDKILKNYEGQSGVGKISQNQAKNISQNAVYAYEGTYNRLNRFYDKKKQVLNRAKKANPDLNIKQGEYQHQGGILLYKPAGEWIASKVINMGDVKEAYTNAILNPDTYFNALDPGNPVYYSHLLIQDFFNKFISKVTNKGAVAGEDIETKDFQYAVKSINATLPNIFQFKELATQILNKKNGFSKEELEQILQTKESERNYVIDGKIHKIENEYVEQTLKEFSMFTSKPI